MYITGDVDLPVEVLKAQAEDRLVVFVGAGASIDPPSDLMMFEALADQVATDLLTSQETIDHFKGHPDRLLASGRSTGPFLALSRLGRWPFPPEPGWAWVSLGGVKVLGSIRFHAHRWGGCAGF